LTFIEKDVTWRMVYGMYFLGRNLVSGLLCTFLKFHTDYIW